MRNNDFFYNFIILFTRLIGLKLVILRGLEILRMREMSVVFMKGRIILVVNTFLTRFRQSFSVVS